MESPLRRRIVRPQGVLSCTTGSAWIAFCGKLQDLFYSNRVRHSPLLYQQPVASSTSDQCQQVSESHLARSVDQSMSGDQPVAGTAGVTGKLLFDKYNHEHAFDPSVQRTHAILKHQHPA